MKIIRLLAILLIIISMGSCKTQKKAENMESTNETIVIDYSAGPTTFIYKTKADYNNYVPVILSKDKTSITSYPHPKDVYYKGKLALPTQLEEGYLLDNRGISENVAFLNITYTDYSKLEKTPTSDELFELILESNPLSELYNCGNRFQYKDEVAELNSIISKKQLKECKKIVVK